MPPPEPSLRSAGSEAQKLSCALCGSMSLNAPTTRGGREKSFFMAFRKPLGLRGQFLSIPFIPIILYIRNGDGWFILWGVLKIRLS